MQEFVKQQENHSEAWPEGPAERTWKETKRRYLHFQTLFSIFQGRTCKENAVFSQNQHKMKGSHAFDSHFTQSKMNSTQVECIFTHPPTPTLGNMLHPGTGPSGHPHHVMPPVSPATEPTPSPTRSSSCSTPTECVVSVSFYFKMYPVTSGLSRNVLSVPSAFIKSTSQPLISPDIDSISK